eukprot:TRINITY_DN1022_c0_g1_i3.p1 TRINITY_DN1022_c0_g1~~TRINITY_DN1022_c0_g1_i3.p1  ORF type:complete len:379 (-),score=79.58 TRINITY_DN1022_c0_g1_i3:71-1207(-)
MQYDLRPNGNGNGRTTTFQYLNNFKIKIFLLGLIIGSTLLVLYAFPIYISKQPLYGVAVQQEIANCRYSHKQNYHKYDPKSTEFSFMIVSDLDKGSRVNPDLNWRAVIRRGVLSRNPTTSVYSVSWQSEFEIHSKLNEGGRGMELSDLAYYNGHLYSFDDRTGIVFRIINQKAIPYRILMDGNGVDEKGMKIEWATVKDNLLYIGSTGKEWTTPTGQFISNNPNWVKTMDEEGRIKYEDWTGVYDSLKKAAQVGKEGYLIHEAVRWNELERRWYFLPRRESKKMYNDVEDEKMGSNLVMSMDENFGDVRVGRVGPLVATHGFSTFQFVPWRDNEVVALKSEEDNGKTATYIMVMNLEGKILMPEEYIGDKKYEGIEIM